MTADSHAVAKQSPVRTALTIAWPVLLLVGLVVFVLPSARPKVMIDLPVARTGSSPVAIFGNSIIDHVSACDTDHRTIAEMLAESLHQRTLDLSYGGQILEESVAYTGAELENPHSQIVILPISLPYIAAYDDVDLQQYLLNRLLTPSLHWEGLPGRITSGRFLEGRSDPLKEPFSYAGVSYPDYNGMKIYFAREAEHSSCPETEGYDQAFMQAYYYHSYLGFTLPQQNIDLLSSLVPLAAAHRKRLYVVLMPMDYERMNSLRPGMGEAALAHAASIAATLRSHNLNVIDLTGLLHNDAFSDRSCACGHLQETGRQQLTAAIAAAMRAHISVAAPS